jgi:WhiB family redox-sensing transcriptional regulator
MLGLVDLPVAPSHSTDWQEHAACRFEDTGLFFPMEGDEPSHIELRYSLAKRICALCPVRQPCLDFALALDERFGIWGGLTPHQRAKLRRACA